MKLNFRKLFGHIYIVQPPLLKLLRLMSKWFKMYSRDNFITPNFRIAQHFFTSECASDLIDKLDHFNDPCCVCTPRLGKEWSDRGRVVRVLDIDKRFSFLPGYKYYDLRTPTILNEVFDVIIMDPNFSLEYDILLNAINTISHMNYDQKLVIGVDTENSLSFLKAFSEYKLCPTGYYPKYCNIKDKGSKRCMIYANFEFP